MSMSNEEFQRVTYKRKSKKPQITPEALTNQLAQLAINADFDKDKAIRRILEAKDDIASSDYYSSVKASVREALSLLSTTTTNKPRIHELICFGIGHFVDCMISRYQFAFMLCLHDTHAFATIKLCDPALNAAEYEVLDHFGIEAIRNNIEAKYVATSSATTLFYLPHCPKQLSNNLLWSNWSLHSLPKCIIVANSFASLIESNTKQAIVDNCQYVLRISPYMTEIAIINCFKYFDIFNDCAIHVFPKLEMIASDFWLEAPEPNYVDDDIEYIKLR